MKNFIILMLALLSTNSVFSKDSYLFPDDNFVPNEVSVAAAGGVVFPQNTNFGKIKTGANYAFEIGYARFINRYFGVFSGVQFSAVKRGFSIENSKENYLTFDKFGNEIEYFASFKNYREGQKNGFLNVPILLVFQTDGEQKFYANIGVKVGFPLFCKTKTDEFSLSASGYYPQYNQTEIWQNDLGYGDFFMQQSTENQPLKVALNGVFELGGKWNLGNGKWLYSGVFADYGLFDLLKSKKAMERTVEYNRQTPENPIINSVLQNTKLQPFSIGLKLKFAFSFEKSNKKSIDIQDVEKIDEDFFEF